MAAGYRHAQPECRRLIAYFILMHRFPEQFKRMFRALYDPRNIYLVHIDHRSGSAIADDVAAFLAPYQGVEILPSRSVLWGGYSLVDAELRGMERLLEMGSQWRHFINLSGQDFPLKSQDYIRSFLDRNQDTEFMRHADQAIVRPDTMNRITNIWIESFQSISRTKRTRPFVAGARPFIGTQWKVVSRRFCEFVCHDPRADRFKAFYRNSFIADEGFFQTVMMNAYPGGAFVDDDLREIDWVPDGDIKLRPRTFASGDAAQLTQSSNLFARKFDQHEDPVILDLLERHLCRPAGAPVRTAVMPEQNVAAA